MNTLCHSSNKKAFHSNRLKGQSSFGKEKTNSTRNKTRYTEELFSNKNRQWNDKIFLTFQHNEEFKNYAENLIWRKTF